MTDKQRYIIKHDNPAWRAVLNRAVDAINARAESADVELRVSDVLRTLDQNSCLWPTLTDWANQVEWWMDGAQRKLRPEDWKDILTAAFEGETHAVPGLNGGMVMLGARTSKYGKKKMGDFLTFIHAEGNERGVIWSEEAKDKLNEYARRAA